MSGRRPQLRGRGQIGRASRFGLEPREPTYIGGVAARPARVETTGARGRDGDKTARFGWGAGAEGREHCRCDAGGRVLGAPHRAPVKYGTGGECMATAVGWLSDLGWPAARACAT